MDIHDKRVAIDTLNSLMKSEYCFYHETGFSVSLRRAPGFGVITIPNRILERLVQLSLNNISDIRSSVVYDLSSAYKGVKELFKKEYVQEAIAKHGDIGCIDDNSTSTYTINPLFNIAFNKGNIALNNDTGRYLYKEKDSDKPKKKKKRKRTQTEWVLSEELSEKIKSVTTRDKVFFRVLDELNVTPGVNGKVSEIYTTECCFRIDRDSFESRAYVENLVDKWNNYLKEPMFRIGAKQILFGNNSISSHYIKMLINKDSKKQFIRAMGDTMPGFERFVVFSGSEQLEQYAKEDFELKQKEYNSYLTKAKKILVGDVSIIDSNSTTFKECCTVSNGQASALLLSFKKNHKAKDIAVSKYNNCIEYSSKELTIEYVESSVGCTSHLKKEYSHIYSIVDEYYLLYESGVIDMYKKIRDFVKDNTNIIADKYFTKLLDKYDSISVSLNNLKGVFLDECVTMIIKSIRITKEYKFDIVLKSGEIVDTIVIDDKTKIFNNKLKKFIRVIAKDVIKVYENKAKKILSRQENIMVQLLDPSVSIIVKMVQDVERKGITTYEGVLAGAKHVDGDKPYYGKLKSLGSSGIQYLMRTLIKEGILCEVTRRASFGSYTSIELGSVITNEILDTIAKGVYSDKVKALYLERNAPQKVTIEELYKETKNLTKVQKNYLLKEISILDIKFLVDILKREYSACSDFKSFWNELPEKPLPLKKEVINLLRFYINLVKSKKVTDTLNYILDQT